MTETRGWDAYWEGSSSGVAFGVEGVDHPVLAEYWNGFFTGVGAGKSILDVASGRGALQEHIRTAGVEIKRVVSLDFSHAALFSQRKEQPDILQIGRASCRERV